MHLAAAQSVNRGAHVSLQVRPTSGLCVVFRQPPSATLRHDGEEVRAGVKYLFRSDVMYARRHGICTSTVAVSRGPVMCKGCTIMVDAAELVNGAGVCQACAMEREWADALS